MKRLALEEGGRWMYLKEIWDPVAHIAYFYLQPSDLSLRAFFAFHKKADGTFDLTLCEANSDGQPVIDNSRKWYIVRSLNGQDDLIWLSKAEADDYNQDLLQYHLAETLQPVLWHANSVTLHNPLYPAYKEPNAFTVASGQNLNGFIADDLFNISSIEAGT